MKKKKFLTTGSLFKIEQDDEKILLSALHKLSIEEQDAVKNILSKLDEANEKISVLERKLKSKTENIAPRVEKIDETHCIFNGDIYKKHKTTGYYVSTRSLHNEVYKFYNGLDEIPSGYVVHHNGIDENGEFDKEKNNIEYLILMERGEHTKLHNPLKSSNVLFTCKICGKKFEAKLGRYFYCSKECADKGKEILLHKHEEERICVICGKKFLTQRNKTTKTCSKEYAYRLAILSKKYIPCEIKKCEWCGKEFKQKFTGQKYCCKECFNHELEKRRQERITKCEYCGKEFLPPRGKKLKFCSRSCALSSRRAKNPKIKKIMESGQTSLEIKKCKYCGKEFQQTYLLQKYCNRECFINDKKKKSLDKTIKCEWCGKEFIPPKKTSKCCSKSCATHYKNSKLKSKI